MLPACARTPSLLRLLFALAVVAVLLERLHALLHAGPTDFDDAYMYLRYAHNALAGQWLTWNPGEAPVYGVTSPLHFLLVTLVGGLLPDRHAAVLQIASGVAAFVLLAALVTLCARFCRNVDMGTLKGFASPFGPPPAPPTPLASLGLAIPPAMVRGEQSSPAPHATSEGQPENRESAEAIRLSDRHSSGEESS